MTGDLTMGGGRQREKGNDVTFVEMDRAIGVVIGGAVGDALGAGYEFAGAPAPGEVEMRPGTLTKDPAGWWTDDTAMAIAILEIAAARGTLATGDAAAAVGDRFLEWFRSNPRDVGNQTRAVLSSATSGADLARRAATFQSDNPDRAGNGSLMRTGPVALAHLGHDDELVAAARALSELTHPHSLAVDACVLWTIAIDRAVRLGELEGPRAGLTFIDDDRRPQWEKWIDEAEKEDPRRFAPNGFAVRALQAAWASIHATRDRDDHLDAGLRQAVAIGDDTDTVAAIAGALLGARYGVTAIPFAWRHGLAGWPRPYRSKELIRLAALAARHGRGDELGWPMIDSLRDRYQVFSPTGQTTTFATDPGVIFGDVNSLATVEADAFVSLCRIGVADERCADHDLVWLLDDEGNADVARVLADTADGIDQLRRLGRTVFVHCVRAESRTPSVAMAWLIRHHGYDAEDAIREVTSAMPTSHPHPALLKGVRTMVRLPRR